MDRELLITLLNKELEEEIHKFRRHLGALKNQVIMKMILDDTLYHERFTDTNKMVDAIKNIYKQIQELEA